MTEQEEKAQQKLNLETSKRQALEDKNKKLQQEIEKMKTPSVWSSIKSWFRDFTGILVGVIGAVLSALGVGAGVAGIGTIISAIRDCHKDKECKFFTSKLSGKKFGDSFDSIRRFILEIVKNINIHEFVVRENHQNNN